MNPIEESWAKLHAEILSLQESIRTIRNTLNVLDAVKQLTPDEKVQLPKQLKDLFQTYRQKLKEFNSLIGS